MFIKKLKLDYFGKIHGKEIVFTKGINLLYGENEAGKSTIHSFIRGMLFGIERLRGRGAGSKEDTYTRYLPWDYPGAYGGQMDIVVGDKKYRLQRSFHANDKSFTIIDVETGREVKLKEDNISELIPGLTEATFRNTISIEQLKGETDSELAMELGNYFTNLSMAKSREVNVEKAITSLKTQRKAIDSIPYASRLKCLSEEIEEGQSREQRMDTLTVDLRSIEAKEKELIDKRDALKDSKYKKQEELMGELPAIIERFRMYQGLTNQYTQVENQYIQLKNQIEELKDKIKDIDKDRKNSDYGDSDSYTTGWLEGSESYITGQLEGSESYTTGQLEGSESYKPRRLDGSVLGKKTSMKKGLLYIVTSVVILLLGANITKSFLLTGVLFAVLVIIGVILYISDKKTEKRNRDAELSKLAKQQEEHFKISVSLDNSKDNLGILSDRRKQLEDNIDELHDTIMIYIHNFISEEELTAEAIERLKNIIDNKKKEFDKEYSELNALIDDCHRRIDMIKWELSKLEEREAELIKNRDRYADIKQKQAEDELEKEAIDLALNTINELAVTIHDGFGKRLNQAVSDVISEVTDHRYQDIKVDEKLNIKMGWNDKYIMLNSLSAGTIDQVYFSLRLAASDLLLGKDNMPLIFDDSFALYDDNRVKAALMQIAERNQVIIFTCQKREKQFLEELGLPFNYVEL